jgi:hypothetical protein
MRAKEAKIAAQNRAVEIKNERDEADRKAAEADAKKWRERRVDWLKNEMPHVEESIVPWYQGNSTSFLCTVI